MRKIKIILISLFALLVAFTSIAGANELGGTSWRVTSYNNGREGIASVIADTEILVYFENDGTLYGSSGCNDFTTAFSINGDRLTVRPAAVTRKICGEHDDIMRQETEFLNALESTATWSRSAGSLVLRTASGVVAVEMKPHDDGIRTMIFKGGDKDAVIEMHSPEELYMTIDGATYHMQQTISASGARYAAVGDPSTVFWNKGDSAWITIKGRDLKEEFKLHTRSDSDDEMYISINGETFRMKRVVSASGAKYEAVDDPTTVFWAKGRNATLTVRGKAYSKYVLIRNSPNDNELFLSVDGENYRLRQVPAASGVKYEATDDPTTVFWSKGDAATLIVKGKKYMGYDTAAKPAEQTDSSGIPINVEWSVESIGGKPIIPGTKITLRFGHNAKLNGRATINTYASSWITIDDRMIIKGAATTMMAGPENFMGQEQTFLKALEDVSKFRVENNKLILTTKDGTEIIARR